MGDAREKENIKAQKQLLRDVTKHPDITAAATPEALKILTLDIIGVLI
jgi:hypothetical protein